MVNRPIKFRAWNKNGRMFYWDMLKNDTPLFGPLTDKTKEVFAVMQFTGLLDKNGKEVYEGDVVRIPKYETRWKNGEPDFDWRVFKVIHNHYVYAFENSVIYTPFSSYDASTLEEWELEVIGNVYENPELLTGLDEDGDRHC